MMNYKQLNNNWNAQCAVDKRIFELEGDGINTTTWLRTYPPFEGICDWLIRKAYQDRKDWNMGMRKSRWFAVIFIALLFLSISVYVGKFQEEVNDASKTPMEKFLIQKMDVVAEFNKKIDTLEKSTEYITFVNITKKNKEMTNKALIFTTLSYMLSKMPATIERDNFIEQIEMWKETDKPISAEELHNMQQGIYFSCENMVKEGIIDDSQCDRFVSWDDYDSMKRYNIYLIEDIIPEFRKNGEFFRIVTDNLWKYHELDRHAHIFDNFRKQGYIYLLFVVFSRAEAPVFMMMYETLSFANIAATTAQEVILEDRHSIYHSLMSRGLTYNIIALFLGYGMVYVPIILAVCVLYCLYTPTSVLDIIHYRFLSTMARFKFFVQMSANGRIFYYTNNVCILLMTFYLVVLYIKRIIFFIIVIFIITNSSIMMYVANTNYYYDYYDSNDNFLIWHHELSRMYVQMQLHLQHAYKPTAFMIVYYLCWNTIPYLMTNLLRFPLWILNRVWGIEYTISRYTLLGGGLRSVTIVIINFCIWCMGYGQIVEYVWLNFFKSFLPIEATVTHFL